MAGTRKGPGEGVMPGMTSNKKTTQRQGFKTNEFIVYPAHGVGQIIAIEEQEVAGAKLELFVINFIKDKMTLRVPTAKIVSVGMRKLAEAPLVKRALETLKGRARIKRTMWSRRAQEYEAKINSGDIVAIAEVGSFTRLLSIGSRARSRRFSVSPRPRRSRRSKRLSPRARAAVRSRPKRPVRRKASRKRPPEDRRANTVLESPA
jgi:RNA polymerase-interacting CarD/CdnL/TRCF family regulator